MQNIYRPCEPIYIRASGAVCGYEEWRGPLGENFDFHSDDELFGMTTYERAEGEMERIALSIALKKGGVENGQLSVICSGDLQNQCCASSGGLFSFGAPYIGLYGACSTLTEGLIVCSSILSVGKGGDIGAVVTSSHNSAAERQFRTPLEYGALRSPSSQWTATAAGAFILERGGSGAKIEAFMPGRIIDGYTTDQSNMGAGMALSAADSILRFFGEENIEDFDLVLTGDLGEVGQGILHEIISEKSRFGKRFSKIHKDAGLLLFDNKKKDFHAGGSGCGCSASVLSTYALPRLLSGEIRKMAILSTGALLNPMSVMQGEHIMGISPLAVICA